MAMKIYFNGYLNETASEFVSYEARNLGNFDFAVNIPVTTFGLPEFYLEGAILTKAEGNTGKIVFSWVIKDEVTTPFVTKKRWDEILVDKTDADDFFPDSKQWNYTVSGTTGDNYTSRRLFTVASDTVYENFDTKTADGQMIALSEYFEKKGFSSAERHKFIIKDETLNKYIFFAEGTITRLSFQKAGTDPVTWNASLEFQLGDVVDSTDV